MKQLVLWLAVVAAGLPVQSRGQYIQTVPTETPTWGYALDGYAYQSGLYFSTGYCPYQPTYVLPTTQYLGGGWIIQPEFTPQFGSFLPQVAHDIAVMQPVPAIEPLPAPLANAPIVGQPFSQPHISSAPLGPVHVGPQQIEIVTPTAPTVATQPAAPIVLQPVVEPAITVVPSGSIDAFGDTHSVVTTPQRDSDVRQDVATVQSQVPETPASEVDRDDVPVRTEDIEIAEFDSDSFEQDAWLEDEPELWPAEVDHLPAVTNRDRDANQIVEEAIETPSKLIQPIDVAADEDQQIDDEDLPVIVLDEPTDPARVRSIEQTIEPAEAEWATPAHPDWGTPEQSPVITEQQYEEESQLQPAAPIFGEPNQLLADDVPQLPEGRDDFDIDMRPIEPQFADENPVPATLIPDHAEPSIGIVADTSAAAPAAFTAPKNAVGVRAATRTGAANGVQRRAGGWGSWWWLLPLLAIPLAAYGLWRWLFAGRELETTTGATAAIAADKLVALDKPKPAVELPAANVSTAVAGVKSSAHATSAQIGATALPPTIKVNQPAAGTVSTQPVGVQPAKTAPVVAAPVTAAAIMPVVHSESKRDACFVSQAVEGQSAKKLQATTTLVRYRDMDQQTLSALHRFGYRTQSDLASANPQKLKQDLATTGIQVDDATLTGWIKTASSAPEKIVATTAAAATAAIAAAKPEPQSTSKAASNAVPPVTAQAEAQVATARNMVNKTVGRETTSGTAKKLAIAAGTAGTGMAAMAAASADSRSAARLNSPGSKMRIQADDLTQINGIGPATMKLLNQNGIRTFAELRGTEMPRLQAILQTGGSKFSLVNPTTWHEQTDFAIRNDWQGLENWISVNATTGSDTNAERFQQSGTVASAAATQVANEMRCESSHDSACTDATLSDDLTRISGIGPATMKRLNMAGIYSFANLRDTDLPRLRGVLDAAGAKFGLIDPTTWHRQTQFAVKGDWDGLASWNAANATKKSDRPAEGRHEKSQRQSTTTTRQTVVTGFSGEADDLTAIRGIGPATQKVLHRRGIRCFEQIANMNAEQIAEAFQDVPENMVLVHPESWAEQATRLLAERHNLKSESAVMEKLNSVMDSVSEQLQQAPARTSKKS